MTTGGAACFPTPVARGRTAIAERCNNADVPNTRMPLRDCRTKARRNPTNEIAEIGLPCRAALQIIKACKS